MNLNNLIKESYEIAKEKGWHDKLVSFAEYIANIHAELSEAWEEWRNNRGLDEIYYECNKSEEERCNIDLECQCCDFSKPSGIPIELADVVIRICDMFGECEKKGFNFDEVIPAFIKSNPIEFTDFSQFINQCHKVISKGTLCSLKAIIIKIEEYCKHNYIDLEQAIELKMAYNKTRPYRHGNKRV